MNRHLGLWSGAALGAAMLVGLGSAAEAAPFIYGVTDDDNLVLIDTADGST